MTKWLLILVISCSALSLTAQLYREDVQVILDQQYLKDVRFADLDNDDDLDFIGNRFGYNGSYLTFFNEDGNGNYASPIPFGDTTWWGRPDIEINFELGDMDNDGDIDIVPGNIGLSEHPFWPNDGTGTFATSSQIASSDDIWDNHYFHLADLDNDGHLDIVTYRSNNREVYINRNLGNGESFEYLLLYDAFSDFSPEYVSDFILLDYDLDGDLDLGFLSHDPFIENDFVNDYLYFTLYEQTCSMCFTQKSRVVVDDAFKYFLAGTVQATDLNGDNYPDLLIDYAKADESDVERAHFRILSNDAGTGDFTLEYQTVDVMGQAHGDYDNDGDQDLFWAIDSDSTYSSRGDAQYYWQENLGNFTFQEHLIDVLDAGIQLMVQDINQDDLLDLIHINGPYTGTVTARTGLPDLSFAPFRNLNFSAFTIGEIVTEDWDEDGDLDILFFGNVHTTDTHHDGIYRQNQLADGTFSYPELLYRLPYDGYSKTFVDLNNDGKLDAIGIEQIYGSGANRMIVYTLQQADGSWSTGTEVGADLEITPSDFFIADWDEDGDQDILTKNHDGEFYLLHNDLPTGGDFSTSLIPDLLFDTNNSHNENHAVVDFNTDGKPDLFARIEGKLFWAASIGSLEFTAWDTIALPPILQLYEALPTDWDADGDQDILIKFSIPDQGIKIGVIFFDQQTQEFLPIRLLVNNGNISGSGIIADLNQDGFPDYLSSLGFRINQLNGHLLSAPFVPEPIRSNSYWPSISSAFSKNALLVDLFNNDEIKIISGFHEILAYDPTFLSTSTLSGFVRWDTTAQCQTDSILPPLENWQVSLTSPVHELLTTTNNIGQYGSILPIPEDYLIQVIPPSGYWAACPADTTLVVTDNESSYLIDFAAEALVDCPLVVIELNSTSISQCFGSTASIGYFNAGTAVATDVEITLKHAPRLLPVGSNIPWTSSTDTTLIFAIGTVGIGQRSYLSIQFEPECEDLEIGEEVCFEASITPNELCEDMLLNWDGANLEANVLCEGDSTAYRITNTGEGATSMPVSYQVNIVNDDIILYLDGTIILAPGESDTIPLPPNQDTWYLQLQQTIGHPYPAPIGLFANDCSSTDASHTPNLLPTGTGDPFRVILCREVIGPYDPNDKSALPIGLTTAHYIQRDWPLDYTIQFQNIGSDRARNVTLIDTLSPHLDLSTFAPLTASHPYEWVITDGRILRITFPEINLPDSTSNEVGSHGLFSFRIRPKATTPFETDIHNFADIYFDFNVPVRTGTTQHRIRKPQRSASVLLELCAGEQWLDQTIHQDTILRETLAFAEYDSTTFYHITALPSPVIEQFITLEEPGIWQGTFIQQDTIIEQLFTTQDGCDSLVLNYLSILTSTSELEAQLQLRLHPNPANDHALLQWATAQPLQQVEIINAQGQVVQTVSGNGTNASFRLSTAQLPSGSYQLLLTYKEGVVSRKLQIVH